MELTPDLLGAGFVGLIIVLGAIGQYLRSLKGNAAITHGPVLAGIGVELGTREQTERMIGELSGIRKAVEILADKRTDEIEEMHRALLDRLDAQERREEQEEQRPHKPPIRRR